MSGNTFGRSFTLTTAGESHGPGYVGIVDGCPPGLPLCEEDLQHDLDRRKPGTSRHTTQRREDDRVHIMSGVYEGLTTGTPIGLLIENTDQKSKDYSRIADTFRPGHADYTYQQKYGIRDPRGGGRSSARETCMRVAAGGIAKKYLRERLGVQVRGYLSQLGPHVLALEDWSAVDGNPFFCAEPGRVPELEAFMDALRKSGESVGARVAVVASGVPLATAGFVAIAISFAALMWAYAVNDTSVLNVVQNSHSAKPMLYKLTGTWGNHEGSLILWIMVLAGCSAAVAGFVLNEHLAAVVDDLRHAGLTVQAGPGTLGALAALGRPHGRRVNQFPPATPTRLCHLPVLPAT